MFDGGLKPPLKKNKQQKLLCTSQLLSNQALLYLSDVTILCVLIAFCWSSLDLQK